MLIETHAHLDYPDFAGDFDDVLRRATEAGVTRIITIGTSVESSKRAVNLAEKYPNIYAVIGVHPTYAEEAEEDVITPLRELAKSPRVVALGETGLDYHRLPSLELTKERSTRATESIANALQYSTEPPNQLRRAQQNFRGVFQRTAAVGLGRAARVQRRAAHAGVQFERSLRRPAGPAYGDADRDRAQRQTDDSHGKVSNKL